MLHSPMNALDLLRKITLACMDELSHELSPRQLSVILCVYMSPPARTVKELSELLGIPKSAICRAVDALVIEGLIKRKVDEEDRRNIILQRTIKGSVFLSEYGEIIMREFQRISPLIPMIEAKPSISSEDTEQDDNIAA